MAKMNEFFKSNYFNADALADGDLTLTISYCEAEVFESRDKSKPDEQKMVVHFEEDERKLALNVTNWSAITDIVGSDDTDDWTGHQITLTRKRDKGIGGQMVWCVRIKEAPAQRQAPQPAQRQAAPPQRPQQAAATAPQGHSGRLRNQADIPAEDDIPF